MIFRYNHQKQLIIKYVLGKSPTMLFSIFNNNRSNKKQTMFANTAAFYIVVLQLLEQLNVTGANNVGMGNHILQEGKVTLAAGSRLLPIMKALNGTRRVLSMLAMLILTLTGICNFLHYKKDGRVKYKGCTVDLLTDKVDEIVFWTSLRNFKGLGSCMRGSSINSNVLPFAYSLTNKEVKEFHNGSRFTNVSCHSCMEGCVEKTGLEVRWAYDKVGSKEYAVLYVNPIATKMVNYAGIKRDMREKFVEWKHSLVINQKGPKFHMEFSNKGQRLNILNHLGRGSLSPAG
uniref:Uncharacterized protein n=1 Tax=Meloidogyne enterolobii TaxID=390850 RepID=A0A6V7V4A8_MELEN|nr:unnamed protein product [Meloidogyne enterolobii]